MSISRLFVFILALIAIPSAIQAQSINRCGTDQLMQQKMQDPNFVQERMLLQEKVSDYMQKFAQAPCANPLIIPVVVHFESGTISNQCMIDASIAQIDQVNEDFSGCNINASLLCTWINAGCNNFGGTAGAAAMPDDGACIQFCLADQNLPASETTIGGYAITSGDYNSNSQNASTAWQGYFNVYVGAAGGNLGFVPFLSGASNTSNTQGASVLTSTWGAAGFAGCEGVGTNTQFGNGATFTHEAGHWFGLEHTFSDTYADTPPQSNPNFGCPTVNTSSCTSSASDGYSGNFMDYVDDNCMFTFTQDQVDIMIATAAPQAQWATNSVSCSLTYPPCGASQAGACLYTADFEPADGSVIDICLDNGNTLDLIDLSATNPASWNWTISSVSGNLTFTPSSSTSQNPTLTFTGGTSGVLNISLTSCDASPTCETETHTITVNLLSGAACPNDCDYELLLIDTFGDGWNGASLDILQNGVSIGTFGSSFSGGGSDGPYTLTLTDGAVVDLIQTNGSYPAEEGLTLTDPFGNVIFNTSSGNIGNGNVYSFTAQCSLPSCTDGVQNGSETGIDCGGTCAPCPLCPAGLTDVLNEDFNSCALPPGWVLSHTNTNGGVDGIGMCGDGTNFFAFDCTSYPTGGPGNSSFFGCVAVMDDDNPGGANDPNGIACITSPIIDLSTCTAANLSFDWEHLALGGSEFYTEITSDGTNWTSVQSSTITENGNESIPVTAFTSSTQVRFCFNDANGWQYGAAIDNVVLCADCGATACPDTLSLSNTISDDYYRANLLIQSDGLVPSGGDVIMEAGQEIELQPSFEADQNSDLDVQIGGCP